MEPTRFIVVGSAEGGLFKLLKEIAREQIPMSAREGYG